MKRTLFVAALAALCAVACGESAESANKRGNALLEAGKLKEAAQAYRVAIQADPEMAKAHYNLGLALGKMRLYDEAANRFREALRLDPGNLEYSRALSITMRAIGNRDS